MGALLFSHIRVTNVNLIKEKITYYCSFKMTWTASFIVLRFLCLACFIISTYVMFISVCSILVAYESSTTYLLTRLTLQVYVIIIKGK